MTTHRPGRTVTALLAVAATLIGLIAGCGAASSQNAATVTAPPASPNTATEQAATMSWLAATNQMWTNHNFAALDQVTTGSLRTAYQYEEHDTSGSRESHKILTLTDLSITLPCDTGNPTVFVAYARTDVFSLGQGVQSVVMVFQADGATWQLAAAVTHFDGSSWPTLCQGTTAPTGTGALAIADHAPNLAAVLTRASDGVTPTVAQAHPFAVNSFLTGSDSIPDQSAISRSKDRSAGDHSTQTFTTTAGPLFSLPLADNAGYWLIGTLEQHIRLDSTAGITGKTWPDGTQVDTPRPATVHHQSDDFAATYTAIDPTPAAGSHVGGVSLNGFFGAPVAATTS
jgi:hypothetical protein